MFNYTRMILAFLSLILFTYSCDQKTDSKGSIIDKESAELISQITSGLISSQGEIKIVFNKDIVNEAQTGLHLKKELFEFEPEIEGISRWENRKTLIFKPKQKLPFRTQYSGVFYLNRLFSDEERKIKPINFTFFIAGREIKTFNATPLLVKNSDPDFVKIEGKIEFSEETSLQDLKDALSVKLAKRPLPYTLKQLDKSSFTLESNSIKRDNSPKEVEISINKEPLNISEKYSRSFKIPAIDNFQVTDIIIDSESKEPQLQIEMSDDLDPAQDITGFVTIKPAIKLKLRSGGKNIHVRAPFEHGQQYTITIHKGLKSRWATILKKSVKEDILFDDMLPEISFSNDGIILTSGSEKKITFQSVNVKKVKLKIIRVFENNLGQYLQMESFSGMRNRRDNFSYSVNRVGLPVVEKELDLGNERNRRLQHEINLSKLIKNKDKGLYLLSLRFEKENMLYETSEKDSEYRRRRRDSYYDDPSSYGYIYAHGQIYKPLMISDLAITYKKGMNNHLVAINNILTARPEFGTKVTLYSYQNQILAQTETDNRGLAIFKNIKEKVFYVAAEKDGQRSALKPGETSWNLSTFNTE